MFLSHINNPISLNICSHNYNYNNNYTKSNKTINNEIRYNFTIIKNNLTSKNIIQNINDLAIKKIDLISINTAYNNLQILEEIMKNNIVDIITIHFNHHFPIDVPVTIKESDNYVYSNDRFYGTSIKSIYQCALKYNYVIVNCVNTEVTIIKKKNKIIQCKNI